MQHHETLLLIVQAVKSGLPLAEAIRLTVGDRTSANDRKFLAFAELLDKGVEPKDAVRQAKLPTSITTLLDTALTSDDFAGVFEELADLEVGRSLTIQKVLQALAYSLLLLISSIITFLGLLVFTVPKFDEIFKDFGVQLPAMTLLLIQFSQWIRTPAWCCTLLVLMFVFIFGIRFVFPRFFFCIPVLGHIGRCMYSSHLLRQLGGQMRRNVPLPDALEQSGRTMRNPAYRKDCLAAAGEARNGVPMPEIVIRYYWLFPTWLAPIIATDSSTGALAKSLRRAAEMVDSQKDTSILFLQVLSLPFFVMSTCSLVGFCILALFLPLLKLITQLSG